MKGFIEVTLYSNCKALFNVASIYYLQESEELTFIALNNRKYNRRHPSELGYFVKESYSEVVKKIEEAVK